MYNSWAGIVLNLTALWMGSWWALQEGTWGGWWNWDSSETFGLMVSLSLLMVTHSQLLSRNMIFTTLKLQSIIPVFIVGYFFIQLNFELVSHNFGSKFFFFFNNNLFFMESVILLVTVASFYTFRLKTVKHFNKLYSAVTTGPEMQKTYTWVVKLTVSLLLLCWVLFSYQPLISYFFWNFLQVTVLNFESSLQAINTLLWILVIIFFINFSTIWAAPLVTGVYCVTSSKLLIIIMAMLNSRYIWIHKALLFMLTINLLVFDLITYNWSTVYDYNVVSFGSNFLLPPYTSFTLDNLIIESTFVTLKEGSIINNCWNIASSTNTPTLNFFSLLLHSDVCSNFYTLSSSYLQVVFTLELYLLNNLNVWLTLILLILIHHIFFVIAIKKL